MKIFVGIVIYAGLPWLGWSLADLEEFFSNPARMAYIVLVIVLQVLMVLLVPSLGSNSREGIKLVPRQRVAVLLLQVLTLAIILVAPFCDRRNIAVFKDVNTLRYLGLILFVAGFGLMNWAEATLGKQFSIQVTIQEGHQLVTGGPFRFLRHPRYSGIILYNLGIALLFRTWLALVLIGLLVLVLLWRIRDEEALLSQEFREAWQQYAGKRHWMIPFLY
jgi:protein-S-isoprenylcysteine O-methyltransferase Ste14